MKIGKSPEALPAVDIRSEERVVNVAITLVVVSLEGISELLTERTARENACAEGVIVAILSGETKIGVCGWPRSGKLK